MGYLDDIKKYFGYEDDSKDQELSSALNKIGISSPVTPSKELESFTGPLGTNPESIMSQMGESQKQEDFHNSDENKVQEELDTVKMIPEIKKIDQTIKTSSSLKSSEPVAKSVPSMVIDGGVRTDSTVPTLKSLQDSVNDTTFVNNLGKAAAQIGAGISRSKVADTSGFDNNIKAGENLLTQYSARLAQEAKDPNSPKSKAFKEYIKKAFGTEFKGDISMEDAEKLLPTIAKKFEAEEARKSREQISKDNAAMRKLVAEQSKNERADKEGRLRDQFAQNQIERYTKSAQGSEQYKTAQKMLDASSKVRSLAHDAKFNGGQSLAMLGPSIAKGIAGEVGVLTEQDVTRYVQSPALAQKLKDTISKARDGKLTDESYENIMRLVDIMEAKSKDSRANAYDRAATQLSRNAGIEKDKALSYLNPDYIPEQQPDTAQASPSPAPSLRPNTPPPIQPATRPDTVQIKLPDGRIGTIPRQNLAEAIKRGAQEVK